MDQQKRGRLVGVVSRKRDGANRREFGDGNHMETTKLVQWLELNQKFTGNSGCERNGGRYDL